VRDINLVLVFCVIFQTIDDVCHLSYLNGWYPTILYESI